MELRTGELRLFPGPGSGWVHGSFLPNATGQGAETISLKWLK